MKSRWTLLELLKESSQYLAQKAIPNPRLDGEVLLANTLGCRRIDLYLRYDQPITTEELARFRTVIRRRSQREPVAYITGVKEFWSLPFKVNPKVLIPRPETELLVEKALELARSRLESDSQPLRILEIGTGSGAVAVSLSVELGDKAEITATDRSPEALEVASINAHAHGVHDTMRFIEGDLFEQLNSEAPPFFMILSNPPYIPSHEIQHLPPDIRDHEPIEALDGGSDGLGLIRSILKEAPNWLTDEGILLMEAGEGQRAPIEGCLQGTNGWKSWRWLHDLQGKDRVVCAERAPGQYLATFHENRSNG
jgi:release factor glutamine methyltransferase